MANRRTKEFLQSEAALWLADGLIEKDTYETLRVRYSLTELGFAGVLRYIGIVGGLLAFFGVLGTIAAMTGSAALSALMAGGTGAAAVYWGLRLSEDLQERYSTSSKIIVTLGSYLVGAGAGFFFAASGLKAEQAFHTTMLFCLPAAGWLAYRSRNSFLLLLTLLTLFHWIGSWETMVGRNVYTFGVQDPRVMWPLGLAAVAAGVYHELFLYPATGRFYKVWQTVGLIYFNMSLLILSSFKWDKIYPAHWVVIFTFGCLAQIIAADKLQNGLIRGFGVTFLSINIFTRYHEFFWRSMDAGPFLLNGGLLLMALGGALHYYLKRIAPQGRAS